MIEMMLACPVACPETDGIVHQPEINTKPTINPRAVGDKRQK